MTGMPIPKSEALKQIAYNFPNLSTEIGEIFNYSSKLDNETISHMEHDETIFSGLTFLAMNMVNMIGDYKNDNKDLQTFINENFETLDVSFRISLYKMVYNMLLYGYSVAEIIWQVINDKVYLKNILPLDPKYITFNLNSGKIVSAYQYTNSGKVEIPADKLFILRNSSEIYGTSSLEPIYRVWKAKNVIFKFWAIAMERYAIPVIYAKTIGDTETLVDKLKQLWSAGVIATDADLQLLEPQGSIASTFVESIQYLDELIYRGLLLPKMLLGSVSTGSYALGKIHLDLFMSVIKSKATLVADEFVDQVISKIIEYNYGSMEYYGEFEYKTELSASDRQLLSATISTLISAGIIDPITDKQWVRDMLNFPLYKYTSETSTASGLDERELIESVKDYFEKE
jgi:phage gp29-like protein